MRTRAWFSVRRRRRSPRYDVGAVALVIVVLAVAAAGVYLLALGAVAFLAWLLRVATRRISDGIAEPPPPPLPPSPVTAAPYLPVLAVDPAVFADDAAAKAIAKRVFESWVRGLPRAPKQSIDLVRSVDIRTKMPMSPRPL